MSFFATRRDSRIPLSKDSIVMHLFTRPIKILCPSAGQLMYVVIVTRVEPIATQYLLCRTQNFEVSRMCCAFLRSFTVKTLAQIKTVYPRSLVFFYDRNIPRASSGRSSRQQLVIEANMEERALDFSSTPASKGSHFTSASFIHRRRVFQRGLLARLKQHHRAFLASLDPPLEIPERDVLRWHEDFDLDSVADVEESEMPQPPVKGLESRGQNVSVCQSLSVWVLFHSQMCLLFLVHTCVKSGCGG